MEQSKEIPSLLFSVEKAKGARCSPYYGAPKPFPQGKEALKDLRFSFRSREKRKNEQALWRTSKDLLKF